MSGSMPQGEMPPIFILTETTVAQKSLSGLDYAGTLTPCKSLSGLEHLPILL